jgi:hypothetical protein
MSTGLLKRRPSFVASQGGCCRPFGRRTGELAYPNVAQSSIFPARTSHTDPVLPPDPLPIVFNRRHFMHAVARTSREPI